MSRIAAGSAEGAEQRQESSGKERTVGLLLVLLVALITCVFSTLDNAVTLVHSSGETDIGQWPRALLALSGLAAASCSTGRASTWGR